MAANLLASLDELAERVASLQRIKQDLEARNRMLEQENADLRRETAEALAARDRIQLDCDFLAVSHKLADSPDTLVDTRRRIAGLIRNIDRCLEMLKE